MHVARVAIALTVVRHHRSHSLEYSRRACALKPHGSAGGMRGVWVPATLRNLPHRRQASPRTTTPAAQIPVLLVVVAVSVLIKYACGIQRGTRAAGRAILMRGACVCVVACA